MAAPFSRTFPDLLRERVMLGASEPLFIDDGQPLHGQTLLARSSALAAGLAARGVRRGDRVGLLMENRVEWLETLFGVTMLGATLVPFSTWSKPAELAFLIEDSAIAFLVTVDAFSGNAFGPALETLAPELSSTTTDAMLRLGRFPSLRGIANLGATRAGMVPYEALFVNGSISAMAPGDGVSAVDDALILYSSGSSSYPKAMRLQHYGLIENGFNIGERQGLTASDRVLLPSPLFWAYGGANALPAALTHGATLVTVRHPNPSDLLTAIERHRCTSIYTLPSITNALVEHPDFHPDRTQSLRTGLSIGSPGDILRAAETLGASEICNIYGASETYGNCCVTDHRFPLERRIRTQGKPLPGVEMRIVDGATGLPLRAGEAGQVEVRGYLMRGYWGANAEKNADAFTEDGFFRTGDVGHLDEDGAFTFVGRDDDMIKRSGINISPVEIEEILLQHPSVAEGAVVGTADGRRGSFITAFVVPAEGADIAAGALEAHCRSSLSSYKIPDRFTIIAALPTTSTGKLTRRALRDLVGSERG